MCGPVVTYGAIRGVFSGFGNYDLVGALTLLEFTREGYYDVDYVKRVSGIRISSRFAARVW